MVESFKLRLENPDDENETAMAMLRSDSNATDQFIDIIYEKNELQVELNLLKKCANHSRE